MAISITFNFDDEWAARMVPMLDARADGCRDHPIIVALLDSLSIDSVDDLTARQKFKLLTLFDHLKELAKFEGFAAAAVARETVVQDITDNFPLEVGDA